MSRAEYDKALDQIRTLDLGAIRQLDATGEDGSPLLELCLDPDEGPDAQLRPHRAARRCWPGAIRELPERERQILALYYEEELTMAEIGEVIGVCESRVSQLRSLALSRLRASLRDALGDRCAAMSHDPLPGRDRRAADVGGRPWQQRSRRPSGDRAATSVIGYNFRRPDRVTKEQIRSLHFLHDRFARNVVDLAVGLPARRHRRDDPLGGAVHLLRVPDVAAGSDGVLRHLDAAARRHRRRSS